MTTSAKTITIGGVSSTSKVDAMGKTENGKTGKSEIAQNLPGSPTTAARRRVTLRDVATAAGVLLALDPILGLAVAGTWLLVAYVSRYSSLAALIAAAPRLPPSTSRCKGLSWRQ